MASRRRKSLPTIKLSESARNGLSSSSVLNTIPDDKLLTVPSKERKSSSLEELDVQNCIKNKTRRHSAVALSPRERELKSPRKADNDTNIDKQFDKGRRHSASGSLGLTKELHSILKKEPTEDTIEEAESEATRLAWQETSRRSSSVDIDMPEGSDIFRLAMADFMPEPPPREVTISTVKLKDSSDVEDELTIDGCDEENNTHVRRIRWSEHVDVIS